MTEIWRSLLGDLALVSILVIPPCQPRQHSLISA